MQIEDYEKIRWKKNDAAASRDQKTLKLIESGSITLEEGAMQIRDVNGDAVNPEILLKNMASIGYCTDRIRRAYRWQKSHQN